MSIFSQDNKVKSNWFKFEKVGDRIEGTYIGKRVVNNQLSGNDQNVYEILAEDGEVWNIGSKKAIDDQMRRVKPGQIIGFEFVEERKSTKAGLSPTKIIQVYANPAVVNEKWLKEREESIGLEAVTADEDKKSSDNEDNTEDEIFKLAVLKIEGVTLLNFKKLVMEKTGLAFIESNHIEIIEKLNTL